MPEAIDNKEEQLINNSRYISRDLSWIKFNHRVLDQAKNTGRTVFDRLKFLAITASNLNEFLMIRVGSLYNYLDYGKKRIDYSGLREVPFKNKLFSDIQDFVSEQCNYYQNKLVPEFKKNGFEVLDVDELEESEVRKVNYYFSKTLFPMLTPMAYDLLHSFPILVNKTLIFGVVSKNETPKQDDKISFVQIPLNLPRFYEIERNHDELVFVPIESIILKNIHKLFKNVEISSVSVFRLIRNGDFDYDDYDESEVDFVDEIQRKLKKRKTGRVVSLEIQEGYDKKLLKLLRKKFDIENNNVFVINTLLDFEGLWQIIKHKHFSDGLQSMPSPVDPPFSNDDYKINIFDYLKKNDLFLHHPYNSIKPVIDLLEMAAVDENVLAIKITIYRLAKDSKISEALLRAAENGKHVSVLFEVKARFDEENNISEGQRLQRAGCFVIYGVSKVKTHTKLLMIIRKDKKSVTRYVHMSSGNYNEDTARLYTDTSFLTAKRVYGNDVSEFFNVITGHSIPSRYKRLITAPGDMRAKLVRLIRKEAANAKKGLPACIYIKVNSLQDAIIIDELYYASQKGVKIRLIVRGICCIRPGREGLSENITVKSIVGDLLEHSRIFYFHNNGAPKVFGGSADVMVRSFERRIESLFQVEGKVMDQMVNILDYSMKDNVNSYYMKEDGTYEPSKYSRSDEFNVHKEFFRITDEKVEESKLEI